MKRLFPFALAVVVLMGLHACHRTDVRKVAKIIAEQPADTTDYVRHTEKLAPFSSLLVDCFADVTYTQTGGDDCRIEILAPQQTLPFVETSVRDGQLEVTLNRRHTLPKGRLIVIKVFAPTVTEFELNCGKCLRLGRLSASVPVDLELSGVGAITCESLHTPRLRATLNGAGNIDLCDIQTDDLHTQLNGTGRIVLAGRAAHRKVSIQGEGEVDTSQLSR